MDAGRCSCWQAMWWKLDFGLQCHSSPSYSPGDGWVMVFCEKNQAPSDLPISITPSSRNNAHCKAKVHHSASMSILSFEKNVSVFSHEIPFPSSIKYQHVQGKLIFSRALQFLAIKDGMDQSKWGVPRNRGTRAAKSMAPLSKPKCKVQGVWAHGTMLKLYVLDPRMPSDSSTVLEMLTWYSCISFEGHPEFQMISCTSLRTSACPCQTLPDLRTVSRAVQEASEIFSQKGQDLPKELLLYDSLIFND